MAKFSLKLTKRYLRDLKLARKRGMDESLLNEIIVKLLDDVPLPEEPRPPVARRLRRLPRVSHHSELAAHIRQGHRHQDYLTLADRHSLRSVRQEEQTKSKMSG